MVIRPAGAHDEQSLLDLRNAPDVRFWSSAPGPIDAGEHSVWFQRARVDPAHVILMAVDDHLGPVGYGRMELKAYVSFAVEKGQRGRGTGQALLRALEDEARARRWRHLHGDVHPGNGPSLGAFGAQGWEMRDIVQVVRKRIT